MTCRATHALLHSCAAACRRVAGAGAGPGGARTLGMVGAAWLGTFAGLASIGSSLEGRLKDAESVQMAASALWRVLKANHRAPRPPCLACCTLL